MRSEVLCFHVFPQSTGHLKIDPKHLYADVTALVGFKGADVGLTPTGPFDHWKTLIVNIDNDTLKGPYADHILIPPGSTGSSLFFGFK